MCEILGISMKNYGQSQYYLKEFLDKGEIYTYGWGVGLYPDSSAQIIKEPKKASRKSLNLFFKYSKEINSKIFLGQLRNSTIGPNSRKNNHPFYRELNGKEYVFVHNGTFYNFKNLDTGHFKPIGDTDSELIFCHLLHCLELKEIYNWGYEDFKWLADKFRELNKGGTLNCILSDGEHLFAYKSIKKENNLYFNPMKNHKKETLDILLGEERKLNPQKLGMAISTRKLTKKHWHELKKGELMVIRDGNLIYSNFF